jgi:hypothetical protein
MFLTTPVSAGVISVSLGTGSPPSSLGGYDMVMFEDARALGASVLDVAAPASATVSGSLGFSTSLEHSRVGSGWDSWSHSYDGDVYWFDELLDGNQLTLTLPSGTHAFYLFLEPDVFASAAFAVSSGGAQQSVDVSGQGGAKGIGFYSDIPGENLTSITIEKLSADFSNGFAVGEFGINGVITAPDESGGFWITGMALLGVLGLRRRMRQ